MLLALRGSILLPALAGLALAAVPVQAQVGGLIRKAKEKSAAVVPAIVSGSYADSLLELRAEVLSRVIAGRQAGRAFAASPSGPAALRSRYQAAAERREDLRQQIAALEQEAERLRHEVARAEAEVERHREEASGLDRRQLAVACQRILVYLSRFVGNAPPTGFSALELEALGRHRKDLDQLCA